MRTIELDLTRPLAHLYLAGDLFIKARRARRLATTKSGLQAERCAASRDSGCEAVGRYVAVVVREVTVEQRGLSSSRRDNAGCDGEVRQSSDDGMDHLAATRGGEPADHGGRAELERAGWDDEDDPISALGNSPPTSPNRFVIRLASSYSVPPNSPTRSPREQFDMGNCFLESSSLYAADTTRGPDKRSGAASDVATAWPTYSSAPRDRGCQATPNQVVTAEMYMEEPLPAAENVRAQLRAGWGRKVGQVMGWLARLDEDFRISDRQLLPSFAAAAPKVEVSPAIPSYHFQYALRPRTLLPGRKGIFDDADSFEGFDRYSNIDNAWSGMALGRRLDTDTTVWPDLLQERESIDMAYRNDLWSRRSAEHADNPVSSVLQLPQLHDSSLPVTP